jgi:hypothetical protein
MTTRDEKQYLRDTVDAPTQEARQTMLLLGIFHVLCEIAITIGAMEVEEEEDK